MAYPLSAVRVSRAFGIVVIFCKYYKCTRNRAWTRRVRQMCLKLCERRRPRRYTCVRCVMRRGRRGDNILLLSSIVCPGGVVFG